MWVAMVNSAFVWILMLSWKNMLKVSEKLKILENSFEKSLVNFLMKGLWLKVNEMCYSR